MRVVVASEAFGDLLPAADVLAAVTAGWLDLAPADRVVARAVSGAGRGLIEAVAAHLGGRTHVVPAQDALGGPTLATVLVVDEPRGSTAYLEAGQVCGPQPLASASPGESLMRAGTRGLGALLLAARDLGVDRVVLGLDDAAVPDLGIGMLSALAGVSVPVDLAALADWTAQDVVGVAAAARATLRGVAVQGAGDLHAALLGLSGASVRAAASWGAGPDEAQELERTLGRLVDEIRRTVGEPRDLVTGLPVRIDRRPGVGAGSGVGFGLALVDATFTDGHECVLRAVGFDDAIEGADLLVGVVESIDAVALHESTLPALVGAAAARGIPAVAIAARGGLGRRETMAAGLSGAYAVYPAFQPWPPPADDVVERLRQRAAAVARTWSPPWV